VKHVARQTVSETSTFSQLRSLLDATERQVVIMRETPNGVREVIQNVDRIDQLLAELASPLYDTRAEEGRAESLHKRLERDAPKVAKLVRTHGHAAALADSPTWNDIAATATATRQRQQRRWLIGSAAAIIVAFLLFVVVPWIFPPTPQANTTPIMQDAAEGNIGLALQAANAERTRVPTDPSGALWAGALYFKQGNKEAATAAWNEAQQLTGDDGAFYFDRANVLTQLGEFDAAQEDAQRLIAMPDRAAYGYYIRGAIAEARGQTQQALQDYQQAATLADQANNPQLTVTARTRMGYLLQGGGAALPASTPSQ
jgi:tetratricopeptide (TPR) repeat protein